MSGIEEYEQIVADKPTAKTFVTMEIPGKHTLEELGALLGDNQEFVTQINTRGYEW